MKNKTLHMIGNAHLDPVWLWRWQEGFQAAKATFRSALVAPTAGCHSSWCTATTPSGRARPAHSSASANAALSRASARVSSISGVCWCTSGL